MSRRSRACSREPSGCEGFTCIPGDKDCPACYGGKDLSVDRDARYLIGQARDLLPAPRYVVTSHASELSWLFEQVRNIFIEIDDYGFLKEEIFGRLGNTANRFLAKNPEADTDETLLAVMH